jgi:ubiquitin-like protein Pup
MPNQERSLSTSVSDPEAAYCQEMPEDRVHREIRVAGSDIMRAEIDALLDAVEEVLEKNPEEFVSSYVQEGGE